MTTMPILPVDEMVAGCNEFEARVIRAAFTTRGIGADNKGKGRLRASKPFKTVTTFEEGCANYAWRMLCFDFVASRPHCCLPVMADCDVFVGISEHIGDDKYPDRKSRRILHDVTRDMTQVLDVLVSRVESVMPVTAQAGIMQWGRALGRI